MDIHVNAKRRDSRLFRSIPQYIYRQGTTMAMMFILYRPGAFFFSIGSAFMGLALVLGLRFLYLVYLQPVLPLGHVDAGRTYIPSLIFLSVCAFSGFLLWADDMYYRLHEYQRFRHEKPALYVDNPLSLMNAEASARFARRFGFDPMAGLPPAPPPSTTPGDTSMEHYLDEFGQNINRRTPLPVVMFEPQKARFRVLPKASAGP